MELAPIRPSAPIREQYDARLLRAVDQMGRAVTSELAKAYRANTPEIVIYAQDASPARVLRSAIAGLRRTWLKRFDDLSGQMAEHFAKSVRDRCDRTLKSQLREAGMTVRFKATKAMNDAYQAVIGENVGLIRSIPEQYLGQVETIVMQSVQAGRDLGAMTDVLNHQLGVTRRRAARIALDQNNKATSTMRRARELQLGIVEGVWLHSAGGKIPRPPHVAFSGQRFSLAVGHDFSDGEGKVLPGQPINCRCTWKAVVSGL